MEDNDLISRSALLAESVRVSEYDEAGFSMTYRAVPETEILSAPAVDAVSRAVFEQIKWERDCAMQQLKDHGIPFGGIAPDVVKVVRCKDCKFAYINSFSAAEGVAVCRKLSTEAGIAIRNHDDFCSYGEQRDDNE